ncbi:hypothetical protein [Burkholderia sp. BE12]|uniref:hypothetical protein n=1 Tax=Burkholderia sp. BE12 TaxID=2082394 RepID=UPI00131A2B5E|nr:hypothetical protein [Burkholderia sp. BE12]
MTTTTTPAAAATPTPEDEFSAAFAELQQPSGGAAPAAEPAPAPAADPAPAVDPAAAAATGETTPAAAPAAPTAATPPAATGGTEPTSAPAPAPAEPAPAPAAAPPADWQAQIAAMQAELAELKKAPAPAPAPAAPAAEPPKPMYTADEQATIDAYLKEWPDVAKNEALLRRGEYQHLAGWLLEQINSRLDAVETLSTKAASSTQYMDIKSLVPDYDQVRDPVLAWVDAQPAYLKSAYQTVTETGTPEDVADLIARFKKETNYVAPAPAAPAAAAAAPAAQPAAAAPAPAAPAALPAAAAAAAAALKPVRSSRSEPTSAPDPNDFDGAFAEYSQMK